MKPQETLKPQNPQNLFLNLENAHFLGPDQKGAAHPSCQVWRKARICTLQPATQHGRTLLSLRGCDNVSTSITGLGHPGPPFLKNLSPTSYSFWSQRKTSRDFQSPRHISNEAQKPGRENFTNQQSRHICVTSSVLSVFSPLWRYP